VTVTLAQVEKVLAGVPDPDGCIVVHQIAEGRFRRLAYRPPLPGGCASLVILNGERFSYPDRPPKPLALDARRRPEPTPEKRTDHLDTVPLSAHEATQESTTPPEEPPREGQERASRRSDPARREDTPPPRPAPLQRRLGVMPSDRPETFDDRD
jgi:hypothetical protein